MYSNHSTLLDHRASAAEYAAVFVVLSSIEQSTPNAVFSLFQDKIFILSKNLGYQTAMSLDTVLCRTKFLTAMRELVCGLCAECGCTRRATLGRVQSR